MLALTKFVMTLQMVMYGVAMPEQSKAFDDMASCQAALADSMSVDWVKAVVDAGVGHVKSAGCKSVTYTYHLSRKK